MQYYHDFMFINFLKENIFTSILINFYLIFSLIIMKNTLLNQVSGATRYFLIMVFICCVISFSSRCNIIISLCFIVNSLKVNILIFILPIVSCLLFINNNGK